jgi:hypothetical protein
MGPSRYPKITEWVDNTTMSSNFGSSDPKIWVLQNFIQIQERQLQSPTSMYLYFKICKH